MLIRPDIFDKEKKAHAGEPEFHLRNRDERFDAHWATFSLSYRWSNNAPALVSRVLTCSSSPNGHHDEFYVDKAICGWCGLALY